MDEKGQEGPNQRVSDVEILEIFRESEDPVLTATEVANHLPIQRRSVYERLVRFEGRGILKSKKVGGRTTVWWYPGYTSTDEN